MRSDDEKNKLFVIIDEMRVFNAVYSFNWAHQRMQRGRMRSTHTHTRTKTDRPKPNVRTVHRVTNTPEQKHLVYQFYY